MPSEDRLARRERARQAGQKAATPPRRTTRQGVRREPSASTPRATPPGASVSPQEEPVSPRAKAAKVVVPDTVERQVRAATAKVGAAEAKRRASPAPVQAAPHPAPDEHQELGTAIKALRPEYLQCRDYLHAWRPFTAQWMPSFNVYEVREQCMRCHTTRSRELDRHGHVLARHYDYPEGYSMKGLGRLTGDDRDKIRLASLLNIIDKKEERKHA